MWLLEALAERCWERNIPMVGGDAWVRFNDARREMKVAGLAYDARRGRLVFTLSSKSAVVEITWMLPARFGGRFLKAVRVNEETVCWTWNRLKGTPYGLFTLDMAENDSRTVEAYYE